MATTLALIVVALAGWATVALLVTEGRSAERRVDSAQRAAVQQLVVQLEDRDRRIHQLEAIADAYRIEGLKNPGSIPQNPAPLDGAAPELPPEFTSFLAGYEDPEAREEAEAHIRSTLARQPDMKPRDLILELVG